MDEVSFEERGTVVRMRKRMKPPDRNRAYSHEIVPNSGL
jgi:hypothetical protein